MNYDGSRTGGSEGGQTIGSDPCVILQQVLHHKTDLTSGPAQIVVRPPVKEALFSFIRLAPGQKFVSEWRGEQWTSSHNRQKTAACLQCCSSKGSQSNGNHDPRKKTRSKGKYIKICIKMLSLGNSTHTETAACRTRPLHVADYKSREQFSKAGSEEVLRYFGENIRKQKRIFICEARVALEQGALSLCATKSAKQVQDRVAEFIRSTQRREKENV
ncbi:unnamed protein product [Clavelina lepadiformis]|uniref:Uncharacterized protein n=1 Tax=Clavelina lepadiformis TaxID=159417 RepID=A0ABP0FUL8_CLALP